MIKEYIIAWVAGLFEGEGSFCFHRNVPKALSITSTDLDVLEKVKDNFGGNIYKENRKNKNLIGKMLMFGNFLLVRFQNSSA